jgi:hypothetical protein
MQYQSIIILKLFMDGMFVYFNYFLLLTLFASFNLNIIYFNDFCVKFRNATNEAFVTDVI